LTRRCVYIPAQAAKKYKLQKKSHSPLDSITKVSNHETATFLYKTTHFFDKMSLFLGCDATLFDATSLLFYKMTLKFHNASSREYNTKQNLHEVKFREKKSFFYQHCPYSHFFFIP